MVEFGIFDHLDQRAGRSPHDIYEDRLQLISGYDRAGFAMYHLAEHHATPLGLAPSPSVFLSAVAQRTENMHFGPMVYCLPLYEPLRLIEEICTIYANYETFETEVLVASIRSPNHVIESAQIGADVVTVPPSVLRQLFKHPLTDSGLEAFLSDWAGSGQSILGS